jgi:ABC-type uncharacterized transport system involved in gliding motility auxiliary subunit
MDDKPRKPGKAVFTLTKNFLSNRNVRYGAVSVAITIMVIFFIVLLNVVLTALFKKYPLDIDLTEDQIFEVSSETKDFLSSLKKDVTIYILNTEDRFTSSGPTEYFIQANQVIHKYEQLSSRVKLEYIDLIRNPDFSARFPEEKLNVNDILVTSGENVRTLTSSDLFNIRSSYYGSYVASSKAEQAMTSALLNVSSDKKFLAAVIKGYDEADVSAFLDLLKLNAWDTVELNLLTEDIPPDVSLLILARPSRDLDMRELQKLDAFLGEGRDRTLFCLTEIDQPALPNLTDFLAEWGLAAEPGLVYETSNTRILMSNSFVALSDFAEEKYAKNASEKGLYPVVPYARPLKVLWEAKGWRTTTTLVKSSGTSGIQPLETSPDWTPDTSSGGAPILALSDFYRTNPQNEALSGHVLLCGSTRALAPSMLSNLNLANAEYFLDLLGQLAKRDDQIYVQDKTLGFTELRVTGEQVVIFTLIFVVLLPLAVLIAGIVVWVRRRHK